MSSISSIDDHHRGARPLMATEIDSGTISNKPKTPSAVTPKPKVQLPPDINRIIQLTSAKALQITNTHANTRDQVEILACSVSMLIGPTIPKFVETYVALIESIETALQ